MSEFIFVFVGFFDGYVYFFIIKDSKGFQGGVYNDVNYDCILFIVW